MSLAESVSRAFSVTPTRHPPAGLAGDGEVAAEVDEDAAPEGCRDVVRRTVGAQPCGGTEVEATLAGISTVEADSSTSTTASPVPASGRGRGVRPASGRAREVRS